jgi:hypothetical protein
VTYGAPSDGDGPAGLAGLDPDVPRRLIHQPTASAATIAAITRAIRIIPGDAEARSSAGGSHAALLSFAAHGGQTTMCFTFSAASLENCFPQRPQ